MSKFTPSKKESSRSSARRKRDHVEIVLSKEVTFRDKTTGFENIDFIHNALPEINYEEIDHATVFLDKKVRAPILISCMTGGFGRSESINRLLASVCEELSIPMGVGSQRQMLDDVTRDKTFRVVREIAPTVPILGNIGATEVAKLAKEEYRLDDFRRLVEVIRADALVVHCNPLQELMQPEGNTNFHGVLDGIAILVENLQCPLIIKEVGAGISDDVARRVLAVGVTHIDVAGAGGTSWSGIEQLRQSDTTYDAVFWDWGIPTGESLRMVAALRPEYPALRIIASGGINDGVSAAKALALGADMVGAARTFLEAGMRGGKRSLRKMIRSWIENIKRIMFLTGARTIAQLQAVPVKNRTDNQKR
jgi:isopentenyl-diphosphate Delta-isomerase